MPDSLQTVQNQIQTFRAELERGEPRLPSSTLSSRFGARIKAQLYRFLWWHSSQLKTLAEITAHQTSEFSRELSATRELIADVKRHVRDIDIRVRQLESARASKSALQESGLAAAQGELEQLKGVVASLQRAFETQQSVPESLRARIEAELSKASEEVHFFVDSEATRFRELTQRSVADSEATSARVAELARLVEEVARQKEVTANRVSQVAQSVSEGRMALTLQDRRLTVLFEEVRKYIVGASDRDSLQTLVEKDRSRRFEGLYVAFEDLFRGSRDEIKERQSVYLPILEASRGGQMDMPILDLGCGRGEWLELLREHDLQASGLDCNEAMVELSRSRGFDVRQSDAIAYLSKLPDSCLGAVTAFHMVEHLPFETTLTLLDESLRVLKRGGLLILETPNPKNLLVGSYTFHFDPSHLKPLPGAMLKFFVEARGFCNAELLELHAYPEAVRFPSDGSDMAERLNEYFYGPQDYAIIARKP
jgi:ubiquinone/menaquinone biosynthesis C-methylase UbiE